MSFAQTTVGGSWQQGATLMGIVRNARCSNFECVVDRRSIKSWLRYDQSATIVLSALIAHDAALAESTLRRLSPRRW